MGIFAPPQGAWISYTPTVTLNGGGGATNGNAVITGAYAQIGKTVHFWAKYALGTTTNFGTLTSLYISLPLTASSSFADTTFGDTISGIAIIGGANYPMGSLVVNSTTLNICAMNSSGTYQTLTSLTPTVPVAWTGAGNTLMISGTYEAS